MYKSFIKPLILIALAMMQLTSIAQRRKISLGTQYYNKNEFALSAKKYTKALRRFRGSKEERLDVSFRLAEAHRMTNNPKKAETYYIQLIKNKYGDIKPVVLLRYATGLNTQGKYAAALPYFNQYLSKVPDDPIALAGKSSSELGIKYKPNLKNYIIKNIKEVNSSFDDYSAVYGDDKYSSILFTSNRKGTNEEIKDNWTLGYFSDLYMAKKIKTGNYGPPVSADATGAINSAFNEGTAILTDDYKKIYFTRCATPEEGIAFCEIQQTTKVGKIWSQPFAIYKDSLGNVGQPAITANGLVMIFASSRPGGKGGKDLWQSTRTSLQEPFGKAENLSDHINTAGDDLFPTLHGDTLLYFASNGRKGFGGLDLYEVNLQAKENVTVKHLPPPFNSSYDDFAISFAGDTLHGLFSSRRTGGKGGDDIYSFEKVKHKISLNGSVKEDVTKKPILQATILSIGSKKDTIRLVTDKTGNFNIPNEKLLENNTYTFNFSRENYFNKKAEVSILKIEKDSVYVVNILLQPIPEKPIVLPDIYYETNKWELLPQYQDSLTSLIQTLKDNPKMVIELASHTDSRASTEYNDTLSLKRAESVVKFLVEKGINKQRLIAKGSGENIPRVLTTTIIKDGFRFEKGTILTEAFILAIPDPKKREAAYQLNRRTEFKVIRKN